VLLQLIDKFGMAVATPGAAGGANASEPVWIQGRTGESRVCGGCHENRTDPIMIAPGSSLLQVSDALDLSSTVPREQRLSDDTSYAKVMGVPWDKTLQPIFDTHCVECHDGTPGAANKSYTVTDLTDMTTFMFTFNLASTPVTVSAGEEVYTYTASYVALLGPSMMFREKSIMVTGDALVNGEIPIYINPGNAHDSTAIQMLNPPRQFPTFSATERAFPDKPVHPAEVGTYNGHNGADAKYQLTQQEYYLLILNADMGGQYYFRENKPGRM
jgi:hypothetical protein